LEEEGLTMCVVDLDAIAEVSDTATVPIRMSDDYHLIKEQGTKHPIQELHAW
jgi:hypothetical protein